MLLGSRLEALLHLDDLPVCDGLRAQLDLDLLQLPPLPHDALQVLLQDVIPELGDGVEVAESTRPFPCPQHPKRSSPTFPRAETNARARRQGTQARAGSDLGWWWEE